MAASRQTAGFIKYSPLKSGLAGITARHDCPPTRNQSLAKWVSGENILATLHAAPTVAHMDLPGFRLHPLKGQMKGFWAVTVRANWRVIFRFDGPRRGR